MRSEIVDYFCDETGLKGQVYYREDIAKKKPAVLVAHAWKGRDQFALDKAKMLAEMGYVGFAADLYGEGKVVESNEEAFELMLPLFLDRKLLRNRITAAYRAVSEHDQVDPQKIGAIGFCFGGATVLELIRSGVDLQGVVSFHGLLGMTLGEQKAEMAPTAEKLFGSLLILHGYQDPMVSREDVVNIQKEFSAKGIDWQMHTYGNASHAFTNPDANEPESGLIYDSIAEKRAMQSMKNFFSEVFV
ncbi:dienelactone hydrolase family protein [Waddlia chondrophila]|uniref:Transposase remnant n=1 Tax=Waddlia chondrophila (strain ATCC VR-1470 / WSU 86-1044) TaxID=716544 RepID=D6YWB9_WADCW|nr:dienelactone hydrolase family protein [Waddlia chondrophila]ADI38430.1 transposase remnant [Waddlia chondrophila WSU 86-1044]